MSGEQRLIPLLRRARTLNLRVLKRLYDEDRGRTLRVLDGARPRVRADCRAGPRPCLYVSCRFHLYLDVAPNGSLKLNFPELEIWELPESCALDVAERGELTLEEVGSLLNVTRERARQLVTTALDKIREQL